RSGLTNANLAAQAAIEAIAIIRISEVLGLKTKPTRITKIRRLFGRVDSKAARHRAGIWKWRLPRQFTCSMRSGAMCTELTSRDGHIVGISLSSPCTWRASIHE